MTDIQFFKPDLVLQIDKFL